MRRLTLAGLVSLLICGCTKKETNFDGLTKEQLIERGKAVYLANCIACHNLDPLKDGAIGPAIAGSSLELIKARVMKAEYPEGYKPKRLTKQMIALPQLEKEVPALFAYLSEVK